MIRLFKVYYPLRTLVLLAGEVMIIWVSFLLATMWRSPDSWLLLNVEGGYLQVLAELGPKILVVTGLVLLLSHLFDLYDSSSLAANEEHAFRLLLVLGFVALALAAVVLVGVVASNANAIAANFGSGMLNSAAPNTGGLNPGMANPGSAYTAPAAAPPATAPPAGIICFIARSESTATTVSRTKRTANTAPWALNGPGPLSQ